jgi:hypothetical protein
VCWEREKEWGRKRKEEIEIKCVCVCVGKERKSEGGKEKKIDSKTGPTSSFDANHKP